MTSARPAGRRIVGPSAVLAAAALWGTVGPAQVLADSAADPGAIGVARLLVGGVVLSAFCLRAGTRWGVFRRDVVGWVLLAALATGIYQVTFMHAVAQLGAALGTAIALGVAPVATGLCAWWWIRDRPAIGWIVGTIAAISGTVVLLNPWGAQDVSVTGVGIALVSGACYGAYTVAAKQFLSAGASPLPATSLTLLIAGVALSPLLLSSPHLTDTSTVLLIGWTGLAGTAAAYALFIYGLQRTTAASAGTLSLAEPLIAALLGIAVLGETLTASAAIGCLILLVGLAVVTVFDVVGSGHSSVTSRTG